MPAFLSRKNYAKQDHSIAHRSDRPNSRLHPPHRPRSGGPTRLTAGHRPGNRPEAQFEVSAGVRAKGKSGEWKRQGVTIEAGLPVRFVRPCNYHSSNCCPSVRGRKLRPAL